MEFKRLQQILTLGLLLTCGVASAQVNIKGNVYGGGRLGFVKNDSLVVSDEPIVTINNTSVTINKGLIEGSVYGGGQGVETDEKAGLVEGNTLVNMKGGQVKRSIYGGGELGSVGSFTSYADWVYDNGGTIVKVPTSCAQGTGLAKVLISGGTVGVTNPKMPLPGSDDDYGYVFCGGRGEADSITYKKAVALAVVDSTYLEISNNSLISASVYGGAENGLVLGNTHVKMTGGQIGIGYWKDNSGGDHWDGVYGPGQWSGAINAIKNGTFTSSYVNPFHECDAFPFGDAYGHYHVFDIFADTPGYDAQGGAVQGSNGHSFFGNLFGGGSGFYPIAPGVWRRTAGRVNGNTTVEITGGHVLTSIYGGNEYTDVLGKATVNMSGGTLGVPRDSITIARHPVTCYLFGAGMGDRRIWANTWNNVGSAEVNVTNGATIFGSVFGGGEEGHVIGDVAVNINGATTLIGSIGYSYVDGNVFGGGRGFSGEALTAGAVGGNITINIKDGLMLGSIYGGGRMASTGIQLADPESLYYGVVRDDDENHTYGHITIDISGGTIGNDHESKYQHKSHSYGGNVFGGGMGRLTKLDGTSNDLWPRMAKAKSTSVTIREAEGKSTIIKGSVYGGSEYGALTADASIDIKGGTVWSNVYGGGYGSDSTSMKAPFPYQPVGAETWTMVQVMPLQRAGIVEGNTNVTIEGGWVKKSVYGGGELASVGTIVNDTTLAQYKHSDENETFALSWPYEFQYADGTGTATLNITGGRVGLTGKDYMGPWNESGVPYNPVTNAVLTSAEIKAAREDNGDLYGGSKGKAGDRFLMAHSANVNNTVVNIAYPDGNTATPENYKPTDWVYGFYPTYQDWATYGILGCLPGAVYGGGENGHVINNTNVILNRGLVGHNIYGGGKGSDTYEVQLLHADDDPNGQWHAGDPYTAEITSITAGKVYNNTNVTVNGGYVVRNIFGGGNRASVGKGNYAGGPGDYQESGYGEKWTAANATELRAQLANSGHTYITVNGGQIGTVNGEKDDLPTGNVFGGSRGEAAPNAPQTLSPRILYYPQFFLGYVNHTHVTIGATPKATPDANSPRLFGSVYGGGQDGHVRWGTQVVVNDAEIGNAYVNPVAAKALVDTANLEHFQWVARGNVFGSGSGTGTYLDENNVPQYSYSSGSVTGFTDVTINGGLIHRNVYGGGSLAIVGAPRIRLKYDANREQSLAKVTVNSAIGVTSDVIGGIDTETNEAYTYGGQVFGGSRGELVRDENTFSTVIYSEVNLGDGAFVPGNVYGGGEYGQVKQCTDVKMAGGTVGVIDYVRKHGTASTQPLDSIVHLCGGSVFGGGKGHASNRDEALVKDSTNVTISGGHVLHSVYGGGELASVGLRDACTLTYNGLTHPDFKPKQGTTTHADSTGIAVVNILGGQVGPAPKVDLEHGYNVPIGLNGVDGYVFGGGKGIGDDPATTEHLYGLYYDYADVNGTVVTVNIPANANTTTNRIWGSIFGGGEDGHVLGDAKVYYISGLMGTDGTTSYDGNIFGGGRNFSRKNHTAGRVRGNIDVQMSGGQLYGSIFGGGRLGGTGIDMVGLIVPDDEGENGRKYGNTSVKVMGGKIGNENLIEDFTRYSMGDVFGGGKGSSLGIDIPGYDRTSALLLSITKNTNVEISQANPDIPTIIYGTVYGGGEVANVGSCTWSTDASHHISNVTPVRGTGQAKVRVSGGRIGIDRMRMRYDLVEGTGNYDLKYNNDLGHVYGGGQGLIADPTDDENNPPVNGGANRLSEALAIVFDSDVTIEGGWVKGSVYGGGENGHIWWDTDVKIKGGQIGAGHGATDLLYDDDAFFNPLTYFQNGVADVATADTLAECYSWPLVKTGDDANRPFDPTYVKNGQYPTDGKTWFGNVFGGGSGYYPYIKKVGDTYEAHWNPDAGKVYGNTRVEITGGHILTSVYGGCEITDVVGTATVKMSGGTLGVPRNLNQIDKHPVTCYLFGAGKGDPRTYFNTKTNVAKAKVDVTGGIVYGSVFGGGEDGHVLDSAIVNVGGNAIIGTTGRSYVDGNIFGGGRGYSGVALTAGVVRGNIKVNITGGTMFGSIYGGGRLASVGTYLVADNDANYGNMMPDLADETHGHIEVNISGGTIGNDYEAIYHTNFEQHPVGGNVFAGAMGRIVKLDNVTVDPLWTRQAKVRSTDLNISGTAVIKGNVYGGAEFGTVEQNANIKVSGGEIWRDVYGAGYGSSDARFTTGIANNPMQLAGRVYGNTDIEVSGGWIKKCIYGGGDMASVGTIQNDSVRHTTAAQLALSWPYEFNYANNTGKANIKVTGGRLGMTGKDYMGPWNANGVAYNPVTGEPLTDEEKKAARVDNGDIYGGGKGLAGSPYWEAHLANVKETNINIQYNDTCNAAPATYKQLGKGCITGAVYGGGENGHVNDNAVITLTKGLVGHAVYGGGKGKDTYTAPSRDNTTVQLYSLTAGKVYGNTTITINGGYVVRSVFGGGNMASVGKGNYVDYPNATNPEETGTSADGLCTITVNGGTLGMLPTDVTKPGDVFKDNIPYGSVFGGCRGAVESESDNLTSNVAHMSFVNNTVVNISGNAMLHGSVFGGGQDGHVRYDADVNVSGGEIGVEYKNPTYANNTVGSDDLESMYWIARGNVFGGGSGIGQYADASGNHYSINAGSVMGNTDVEITGGRIHRNVYGGGNLATVGDGDLSTKNDVPKVSISGNAKVGLASDVNGDDFSYGGSVFGAGRGRSTDELKAYCNVDSTTVLVSGGHVYGDVYGGGENGHVLGNTDVKIQGGVIGTYGVSDYDGNVYGGGKGSSYFEITGTGTEADTTFYLNPTCGRVGGNTNVTITAGSTKASVYGGGRLALTGVDIDGKFVDENHGNTIINITGGTIGTSATDSLLICDYSVGDVFGSGKGDFENYQMVDAGRVTNSTINISGDNTVIHGNVVGGGEMAGLGWWDDDAKYYANTGSSNITIDGGSIGSPMELTYTEASNPGQWTMYENGQLIHTCTGNVFGGGQGDVDTECPAWVSMGRARETSVTINGGSIMSCVYGGGEQGVVTGNTRVVVNDGTVGSFVNTSTNSFYFGGVYGAGYGSDDPSEDNSTAVNDSTLARQALNLEWTPAVLAGRVYGDSRVDVLGGTILGNVYGGGERAFLGYEGDTINGNALVNIGKKTRGVGYEGDATFGGNSGVFGGNKFAGTPFGNTEVNIYQTAHTPQNTCPPDPTSGWTPELLEANADTMQYAIRYVFGGGDMSNYNPHKNKSALTHVWQCENTIEDLYGGGNAASIGDYTNGYYTDVKLIIDGGRMHRVFGGGNGTVVAANIYGQADTYIYGGLIDQAFGGSNNSGTIVLDSLHIEEGTTGCTKFIHEVFGGSSAAADWGDIVAKIECGQNTQGISTFYGGSEHAEIIGNLTVNIMGGDLDYVFAGSKGTDSIPGNIKKYPTLQQIQEAPSGTYPDGLITYLAEQAANGNDLYGTGGNVTLNLYGGTIKRAAFGGNDFSGRIEGKITVNVIDTVQNCPLYLEDLYGAGRSAAYEPIDPNINSPEINVIHGIVHGTVYGGGQGASATVKANPVVNIGYNPNTMAGIVAPMAAEFVPDTANAYVMKNVFGGGNRAGVVGNTIVNIMKNNTAIGTLAADTLVPGTGNVYGGGQGLNTNTAYALVQGNNTVKINNGKVYGNVYGGGEIASVTGNTRVELTGGEIGVLGNVILNHNHTGDSINQGITVRRLFGGRVYGGGQGDDQNKEFGHVFGNSYVSVSNTALIHNCVYGGGMLGSVGSGNLNDKNSGVATVVISGGEVGPLDGSGLNAYVYGGGRGKNKADGSFREFANVDSTSLIVTGGKVYGSIFGGSEDGHVLGDARIDFNGGQLGTTGKTSWDGNIFGGGRNYDAFGPTAGRVGGNVVVEMYGDAQMMGNIYGGGRKASVGMMADGTMYPDNDPEHGNIYVTVNNVVGVMPTDVTSNDWKVPTSGSVYGGCMGDFGHPDMGLAKNTYVNIMDGAQIIANVYGGGEMGTVVQNAHVNIQGGQIGLEQAGQETVFGGCVYGGGLGLAGGHEVIDYGNVDSTFVNISDGYITNAVFGGGDNGHVMYNTDVTISGGTIGKPLTMYELYVDSLALPKTHIYTGSVIAGGRGVATIDAEGHHNDTTGRVFGNTNLTITGGTINHAVYGGGGLSSVGTYTLGTDGLPVFAPGTGKTTVTVTGDALIGPKKENLINPSPAELAAARVVLGLPSGFPFNTTNYIDYAFRFLGVNEGWVFGAGCGLASNENGTDDFNTLTFNDSTVVNIGGNAQIAGAVFGGGENGRVMRNAEVNIDGGLIGGYPLQGPGQYTIESGEYQGVTINIVEGASEIYEDEYGAGRNSFRGSIFGGGKGSDTIVRPDQTNPEYRYSRMAGQVFGDVNVNISGGTMYGRVYGGGAIANVGTFTYDANGNVTGIVDGTGNVNVTVSGGNIGTCGHNNGDVFGGGLGRVGAPDSPLVDLSYVGNTRVEINNGAQIPSSVYGGSANGHVLGDAHVIIDGEDTKIGTANLGKWHGNVYGGGGGSHQYRKGNGETHHSITSGRVFGNTKVEIKNGQVLHNVYGGGALASVGTYDIYATDPSGYVIGDTGNDTIIITGGVIGTNGDNNGMVYGSGRGVMEPLDSFMDSLTYAVKTAVIIGTPGATNNAYPKINGSVYGSGENGHVFEKAVVTVNSGTIGCTAAEYAAMSDEQKLKKFPYRGNVYGAGCGSDNYDSADSLSFNPKAGLVQGETEVNINGGYISRNVYGGGAMASVGFFTWVERHTGDTLSWPDTLKFAYGGTARVNIKGGHIGTAAATPSTTGNVFGSSRGKAADRYVMAPYANVKDAYVNVNFTPNENNRILGSVYGSGESGHVYDNTYITIDNGLIIGAVFGGGDGTELYKDYLLDNNDQPYLTNVRSITAGKVYGNTNVTVNNGTIQHNVYGGGNLASVGKGNYYDYGEGSDQVEADSLLMFNSGVCTVTINGGNIGTNGYLDDDNSGNLNGFVFGSSRGTTYVNFSQPNRFKYTRDFFLGYANQTNVTIANSNVKGSVFGGGNNGHVRLNTNVVINEGSVIGTAYDPNDGAITDDKWKYRGNVYGAGRGVDRIESTNGYCFSAGSVTRNTHVTVNGGTIHHDVFGGGSLASVGPAAGRTDQSLCTVDIKGGTIGDATGVANQYGGNVYGSSRGEVCAPTHPLLNMMASAKATRVNIGTEDGNGNPVINGSVYGSGENGHVNNDAKIYIYSGRIGDTDNTDAQANEYCGNVFGAGSGTEMYDSNNDNTPDAYNPLAGIVKGNTTINVEGGWVMRSIYGGGEMANVGTIAYDTTQAQYKHTDPDTEFALSWPYEFIYTDGTGTATINVTGGRIGITGKDADMDNGDIYGGGKGLAGPAYAMAHYGNVKETYININMANSTATPQDYKTLTQQCIAGAVYGGSENGHVNENTNITLTNGLIGHAIYGGGKGKGKYGPNKEYSLTAGKVYGNTNITVNGGYVVRSVFGGGNLASVGKGNYAGYGEMDNNTTDWPADGASGTTYININGGQLGMLTPSDPTKSFKDNIPYGSVFGGSRGEVMTPGDNDRFGYVNYTHVVIGENGTVGPRLYGSVYGGAQDGHVRWNTDVAVNSGKIGVIFGDDVISNDPAINNNADTVFWIARGNVLGGGSGLGTYTDNEQQVYNPAAGLVNCNALVNINGGLVCRDIFGGGNMSSVGRGTQITSEENEGHAHVFVNGGTVRGSVFGGGNQGIVFKERVVTIQGNALVKGDAFGGSDDGSIFIDRFTSLKTINVRGGHIEGSVYGCSNNVDEGSGDPTLPDSNREWTGFVNITGGEIDGNVYAAGKGGTVYGTVALMTGLTAIQKAPTTDNPFGPSPQQMNTFYNLGLAPGTDPTPAKIKIGGSLYGGSHHVGNDTIDHWNQYDVKGFSAIFVDGQGYDTQNDEAGATTLPYMNIGGGIYGSGEHCESGELGREIFVINYGQRTDDTEHPNELVQATRTLTTIQRGGIVLLDKSNVNLTGAKDVSNDNNNTKYGMMKVDLGLMVTDGSGIVLGATDNPAYMDSIKMVKSFYLKQGLSPYQQLGAINLANWEVIGIKDNDSTLYRLHDDNTQTALNADEENVIRFNDESKLWVRYHEKKAGDTEAKQYYGELQGFFRMRGDAYKPDSTISFAYARPKLANYHGVPNENTADGGFLSYNNDYNYHVDQGEVYTNTKQHPYTNVLTFSKGDRQDYRMWVGQLHNAKNWYVDGRANGWGCDTVSKVSDAGLYPDKPKKTLFGAVSGANKGGIITEHTGNTDLEYSYEEDMIYVVGELSAADEAAALTDSITALGRHLPLVLYRYPGGHPMSNGMIDNTVGTTVTPTWGAVGSAGPGANYGAMANVQAGESMTMQGVVIDGLYNCTAEEAILHQIPESFVPTNVEEPLVVMNANAILNLSDSTVLKRGFNKLEASNWYTNPDYSSYDDDGAIHNGAAIFVDTTATVNVSGKVYAMGNVQKMSEDFVESNVYLPSFASHLNINAPLDASSRIGVTSPKRNKEASYRQNTLSPVAVVTMGGSDGEAIARNAWNDGVFTDDQQWFFGNGGNSTYYTPAVSRNNPALSFGWTWANVVRTQPVNFAYNNIDSPEDLAWLISQSTGMNGQTATDFKGVTMKQTRDIDLNQYVWVPIGDTIPGLTGARKAFSGNYDGQGHLINNLNVEFIGRGDNRYERRHYGMFGYVKNGSIDRTFVVSGIMAPQASVTTDTFHVGGLVGCLEDAIVSNSEAALEFNCPNSTDINIVTGGLVANLLSGEIHSSMAMPWVTVHNNTKGTIGGLVGNADEGQINNSFVRGKFSVDNGNHTAAIGGLLGSGPAADLDMKMRNCYVSLYEGDLSTSAVFHGIVNQKRYADIDSCYVMNDYALLSDDGAHSGRYSDTYISSDLLGYMYSDNTVQTAGGTTTPMFQLLNNWVDNRNKRGHTYARWARPGLYEINDDLPVLLLNEFDVLSGGVPVSHQGSFRSVATYDGTTALQYGGPVRDGNEIDGALTRPMAGTTPEYLFVYGDVNNVSNSLAINVGKVSIHEDAAISNPAALTNFENTYVGVTFDNSSGHAYSTPGMNIGLMGGDGFLLPRDWHMFSSPLSNAPLGFDYQGTNVNDPTFQNNPWVSIPNEFNWLHNTSSDEVPETADKRYWMNDFVSNVQSTDGYFPTRRGSLSLDNLFIVGSDECPAVGQHRYPYGMDLYTWTEPDYHWINFKRNGPNHWHSDEVHGVHDHLDYEPVAGAPQNVNEEELIVGRGYMGAITTETFMQSHGNLNTGDQTIMLTNTRSSMLPGWNLVGNPYHGYLDFDKVGDPNGPNRNVLAHHMNGDQDEGAFYVIYDADYFNGDAATAFRYYPVSGSPEGDYAGRFLHPHQGFYVRTEQENGGNLTFSESMLVNRKDIELAGDTCTFRSIVKPSYPLVNLYLNSDKGCADVTVIEFMRPEWGGARKLKELRVGDGLFYAHHDNAYYAALFAQEGVDRVPLWFEAKDDDIFTIKWNLANADFNSMYLIDNIAGVEYDMLKNSSYSFEGHTDDYPSRFLIVFDLTGIEEQDDEEEHNFAFFNGSEWVVTGDGDLEFIDMLGQVLAKEHISGQTHVYLPLVADGPYMFRLTNNKQTKLQKVIITK